MMSSILLKDGTALIHGPDDHVEVVKTNILIEGNKITKIAKDISIPSETKTIDCTDKIISPGFIDTHHHVWQTQLKVCISLDGPNRNLAPCSHSQR
jgi:cytosine/adenosine deaminase-related metal-dependent hydrolase